MKYREAKLSAILEGDTRSTFVNGFSYVSFPLCNRVVTTLSILKLMQSKQNFRCMFTSNCEIFIVEKIVKSLEIIFRVDMNKWVNYYVHNETTNLSSREIISIETRKFVQSKTVPGRRNVR